MANRFNNLSLSEAKTLYADEYEKLGEELNHGFKQRVSGERADSLKPILDKMAQLTSELIEYMDKEKYRS